MAILKLHLQGARNQIVKALLRPYNGLNDILLWFSDWFPKMCDLSGAKIFEDSHWKVDEIWEYYSKYPDARVMLLEAEDKIQGFVIIIVGHIGFDKKPCIYIPFLSVAPWNRKLHDSSKREIKYIGKTLIGYAALIAYKKYNIPSVELHSLPDAENFYRKIGMLETGRTENNLKEFRLNQKEGFDSLRFFMPCLAKGGENEK